MAGLAALARWEFMILIGGFVALVTFKVVTGAISLSGLLTGNRTDGTSGLSPGRIQLLGPGRIQFAGYYDDERPLLHHRSTSRSVKTP